MVNVKLYRKNEQCSLVKNPPNLKTVMPLTSLEVKFNKTNSQKAKIVEQQKKKVAFNESFG